MRESSKRGKNFDERKKPLNSLSRVCTQFWQKLDKGEVTLKLGYFSTAKTMGALDSACHLAYQMDHHALFMGYLLSLGMLKPLCPFLTCALLAGNTDCLQAVSPGQCCHY